MPRRKVKEEVRKPDIVIATFAWAINWVRTNPRTCIIACVIAVVLGLSGWGYTLYQSSRDEKVQYLVAEGINNFQEYTIGKKQEALGKAENAFKNVLKERASGPGDIAKLYLARIAVMKGKNDEAKAFYHEIIKNPSNDVVKKLSETALQEMEKKG